MSHGKSPYFLIQSMVQGFFTSAYVKTAPVHPFPQPHLAISGSRFHASEIFLFEPQRFWYYRFVSQNSLDVALTKIDKRKALHILPSYPLPQTAFSKFLH